MTEWMIAGFTVLSGVMIFGARVLFRVRNHELTEIKKDIRELRDAFQDHLKWHLTEKE